MSRVFFLWSLFLVTETAQAGLITVEPIVGYETLHQATTGLQVSGLLVYGGRLLIGRPKLALETEYAQGSGSQSFTSPAESVALTYQMIRVGLRHTFFLGRRWDFIIRGGGQDTKLKSVWNQSGTITTLGDTWTIKPYGGVGLEFYLSRKLSFLIESTYILNSTSLWGQNDLQTTFGVNLHF